MSSVLEAIAAIRRDERSAVDEVALPEASDAGITLALQLRETPSVNGGRVVLFVPTLRNADVSPAAVLGKPVDVVVQLAGGGTYKGTSKITFASPVLEGSGRIRQFRVSTEIDNERVPKPINFSVNYLRSAGPRDTQGRAEIVKHGRRIANVRVLAWQEGPDKPVAAGVGNFLL